MQEVQLRQSPGPRAPEAAGHTDAHAHFQQTDTRTASNRGTEVRLDGEDDSKTQHKPKRKHVNAHLGVASPGMAPALPFSPHLLGVEPSSSPHVGESGELGGPARRGGSSPSPYNRAGRNTVEQPKTRFLLLPCL